MSSKRITVLDFKHRVRMDRELGRVLDERDGEFYAFTPYAAWILEEAGIPFKTLGSILPVREFYDRAITHHARWERVLARTFPEDTHSYFGLIYQLKILSDLMLQEDVKFRLLRDETQARLLTDAELRVGSWHECIHNSCAIYAAILKSKRPGPRVHHLKPVQNPINLLKDRLKAWGVKDARDRVLEKVRKLKAGKVAVAHSQTLVANFAYDWAIYREELEKRYNTVSVGGLIHAIPKASSRPEMAEAWPSFREAFRREFDWASPEILDAVEPIVRAEVSRYLGLHARISKHLPAKIRELGIVGSASIFCGSYEEFLINYFLKKNGLATVFYQHGAYFGEAMSIEYAEVLPATINLVFGDGDREFFSKSRFHTRSEAVGSALLDAFTPTAGNPPLDFLYVLDHATGNATSIGTSWDLPEPDSIELFRRHRRVIDLFARYPDVKLALKPHPAQFRWALYVPWEEYVQKIGAKNISVIKEPMPANQFLDSCETLILDYTCTTLVQALAKEKSKMICLAGELLVSGKSRIESMGQAFPTCRSDDEFVALLGKVLQEGTLPARDGDSARRFERDFGRRLPQNPSDASTRKTVLGILEKAWSV